MTEKPVATADRLAPLRAATPARIFLPGAGAAVATGACLDFALAHARARDAVESRLDAETLAREARARGLSPVGVESAAPDRRAYLARPDLGRRLADASRARLSALSGNCDLAFVVADGLSAGAVMAHAIPLLDAALPLFRADDWTLGPLAIVGQGRVAIGDEIGDLVGARLVAVLIGERPGLSSPDSLGVYLTFAPRIGRTDAERNCLSNIHGRGMSCAEAAQRLFFLCRAARRLETTGVALKDDFDAREARGLASRPQPEPG